MLRGDHDGISTNDDLLDFFKQLPNGDRQFVILPNVAHSIGYSKNRHMANHVMAVVPQHAAGRAVLNGARKGGHRPSTALPLRCEDGRRLLGGGSS